MTRQSINIGPQEQKLNIDKFITQTGIVGEFDIDNNDVIRFVVEGANPANNFKIRMKLKNQLVWVDIADITGTTTDTVKSDTYDLMQVECDNLDGTNIKLLASGFIDG